MRLPLNNRTFWLPFACFVLSAATAFALAADGTVVGWTPLVSLWGHGDVGLAVRSLRDVTQAYDTVLHHTEIDEPTQKFIDRSLEELQDFNLEAFHELLPEKRDGFRELLVRGDLSGKKYLVKRALLGTPFEVGVHGPRRSLADMSGMLRAQPHANHGDYRSYLIGGRIGLGIGNLSWRALTDAGVDFLRLASTADPRANVADHPQASDDTRTRVKTLNPGLGDEDVEVLALLYDAFPALAKALGGVGKIEDVRVQSAASASYQHLTLRMRALPDRLKQRFPDFAKHLRKLGDLARANVRWVDSQGRTIMNIQAQTNQLLLAFDCYVKDGHLLPFRRAQVFEAEPIDPMGDALKSSRFVIDARLEMLGVIIKLDQLRADVRYEARETYASVDASVTQVPGIRVEGRALGFLPTGLLDAFIPGNMEGLTREFFEVATRGNNKKGIAIHSEIGSEVAGEKGAISTSLDVEALDNFLVKMGVGIVNDRVLPDDDAIHEQKALAAELHDAFVRDLTRFTGRVGG
jgi:hypothetical protein